jgi:hypothetical protein
VDPLAYSDQLRLYGQFVGSWDVESSLAGKGEWHFRWILGGTAIQDVIYPAGAPADKHGITVRTYEPRAGIWHLFYTCPSDGEYVLMTGRQEGDRIVQLGRRLDDPQHRLRWSFHEIRSNSYRWSGESSTDGEKWSLVHEMRATRRA